MILKSFRYSLGGWSLDNLEFGMTNLVVGKNSVGKTRFLWALQRVRSILAQSIEVESVENMDTRMTFSEGSHELELSFSISNNVVMKESLAVDGVKLIERDLTRAMIDDEVVNPPENKLLMHVRRDLERYPAIENVLEWAERTLIRSFIDTDTPTQEQLYDIVSNFSEETKARLVSIANEIGFPLRKIDTFESILKLSPAGQELPEMSKLKFVIFEEEGVPFVLLLDQLSNGMRRSILLFILIEYIVSASYPALIAVDDLGEGLDYVRSTKVGRMLFDRCKNANVQLIATSNEELMMNIVDISQWNILVRNGQKVNSITYSTAPDVFENFRYSGLNNFDFFTSDVLNRVIKQ